MVRRRSIVIATGSVDCRSVRGNESTSGQRMLFSSPEIKIRVSSPGIAILGASRNNSDEMGDITDDLGVDG